MKISANFIQASLTSFSYFATCRNLLLQVFHQSENSEFQRIWLEQQQHVWGLRGWDDSILHLQYMLNEASIYCVVMDDCYGRSECLERMLSFSNTDTDIDTDTDHSGELFQMEHETANSEKWKDKQSIANKHLLQKLQIFVAHASQEHRIDMYDLIYLSWISKWIIQDRSPSFLLFNILHLFNSVFNVPWVLSESDASFSRINTMPKNYNVIREIVYTECAYINDLCLLYRYKCKLSQLLHTGIMTNLFMNLDSLISHHAEFAIELESAMASQGANQEFSKEVIIQYILNQFATTDLLNLYFVWSTEYINSLRYFQSRSNTSLESGGMEKTNHLGDDFSLRRSSQEPTVKNNSLRRGNSYKLRRFMSVRQELPTRTDKIYAVDPFFNNEKSVEMILIKPVQRICKYEMFFASNHWKKLLQNLNRQITLSGTAVLDFEVFRQTVQKWKGLDISKFGVVRYRSQDSTQVVVVNNKQGVSTRNVWMYIFTNGLIFFEKDKDGSKVVEIKGYLLFSNINGPPSVNQETKTLILATSLDFMKSVTIFFQDDVDFAEILLCLISSQL